MCLPPNVCLWNFAYRVAAGSRPPTCYSITLEAIYKPGVLGLGAHFVLETVLVVILLGEWLCYWHLAVHETAPLKKNYLTPKVNSGEVEKPSELLKCSNQLTGWHHSSLFLKCSTTVWAINIKYTNESNDFPMLPVKYKNHFYVCI